MGIHGENVEGHHVLLEHFRHLGHASEFLYQMPAKAQVYFLIFLGFFLEIRILACFSKLKRDSPSIRRRARLVSLFEIANETSEESLPLILLGLLVLSLLQRRALSLLLLLLWKGLNGDRP